MIPPVGGPSALTATDAALAQQRAYGDFIRRLGQKNRPFDVVEVPSLNQMLMSNMKPHTWDGSDIINAIQSKHDDKMDALIYQGMQIVHDPAMAPDGFIFGPPVDKKIQGRSVDCVIMDELVPVTPKETKMFAIPDNAVQRFLNLKQMANDLPDKITSGGFFKTVEGMRDDAKELASLIETARTEAKAPFIEQGRAVDDAAKLFSKPLQSIVEKCDALRREYRDSQTKAQAGPPIPAIGSAEPLSVPDLSSFAGTVTAPPPVLKSRTHKVVEIREERLIPEEYYVLDMVKLRADLLAGKIVPGAGLVDKEILL